MFLMCLTLAFLVFQEDEVEDIRFQNELVPKVEEYLQQNYDLIEKLPQFVSTKKDGRSKHAVPAQQEFVRGRSIAGV